MISTRHTYTDDIVKKFNLESYYDIEGDIDLLKYKRVACQTESLKRVIHPENVHTLILDEIVSIIDQSQSRLKGASASLANLFELVYQADRVIVMDNDLNDRNIEWIKALRPKKKFAVIRNTFQTQRDKKFRLVSNKGTVIAELWKWAEFTSTLEPDKRKGAVLICHLKKELRGIVHALKIKFPRLRIKEYHGRSDPEIKHKDFSNIEKAWEDIDLVAYTSTLKIGVSCISPKFEKAFCLFNSIIETNAGTNQMLFRMRCINNYLCHIQQKPSSVPITEKGLFQWLFHARRECLPEELKHQGNYPNIDSIISQKNVPTIRLWVAYQLEKFRSKRLFAWRMVDFLRKAGMYFCRKWRSKRNC